MSQPRRTWPWTVAAVVGVLVLYVLSVGPAIWLLGRDLFPGGFAVYSRVYLPLDSVLKVAPRSINVAMLWYLRLWTG